MHIDEFMGMCFVFLTYKLNYYTVLYIRLVETGYCGMGNEAFKISLEGIKHSTK